MSGHSGGYLSCTKELLLTATVIDQSEIDSAVYVIHCIDEEAEQESQGTAFFLHPYGIVSCEHVVRYPAGRYTVEDKVLPDGYFGYTSGRVFLEDKSGRKICELEVDEVNERADIAILKPISVPTKKTLSLTLARMPAKTGEAVSLLGFPDHTYGKPITLTRGHITNLYPRSGVELFDINEQIQQGNSGGPVVNAQLKVIGVAMEGQKDMKKSNAVVSIEMIAKLMASSDFVKPHTTPAKLSSISPPSAPLPVSRVMTFKKVISQARAAYQKLKRLIKILFPLSK